MIKNPYHWLKTFATTILPGYLLKQPQDLFEAVRAGRGSQYLYNLSCRYAQQSQCLPAPQKCLHLDYTSRYKNTDALFIDIWPGLQLQEPPVYLAVIRRHSSSKCRIFRLHYPGDKQLYMSELQLSEQNSEPAELPPYENTVSLIFSYTLGTRSGAQKENIGQEPGESSGSMAMHELV